MVQHSIVSCAASAWKQAPEISEQGTVVATVAIMYCADLLWKCSAILLAVYVHCSTAPLAWRVLERQLLNSWDLTTSVRGMHAAPSGLH